LTIFWHCGFRHFSFRTASERATGNEPSMVLVEDCASKGSGNADSQRKVWSSGWSGLRRAYACDSGCVAAHPASWRASASYLPLRAVWAVCAWALRGCARSPGPFSAQKAAPTSYKEKLEVAEMLDDMGVDVIEAGFPITSEGDFQAVSEIARRSKNAVIAGLARAHPKDIDRCAEAVKFAKRVRVHTVIATSPLHMRVKLNMTPEQVIETSIANVTRARNHI